MAMLPTIKAAEEELLRERQPECLGPDPDFTCSLGGDSVGVLGLGGDGVGESGDGSSSSTAKDFNKGLLKQRG